MNSRRAPCLLALDVDGTLIRGDGSISARTTAALHAVADAGATITLATGRDWNAVRAILEELPAVGYALCINGIEVFDRSGRELHAVAMDPSAAAAVVRELRRHIPGIAVGAGIDGTLVGERAVNEALPAGVADATEVADIIPALGEGLRDLVLYHPELSSQLDRFHDLVEEKLGDHSKLEVAYTGLPMIELVPPGTGKHTGLAWLADHLRIKQSDVIAIGDGRNDLTMLGWAGTGVAMGQAPSAVRAAADEVALAVHDDGLARWLEARF